MPQKKEERDVCTARCQKPHADVRVITCPEGKYTGRKPTAMNKSDAALSLLKSGLSKAKVCEQLGISRASLYRILAA
ncbi:helix-turn-helix domain-containing protein [Yoonia sp.]|uniref:helix-turn-helix domain-containing protein n=1 Tax=Yoonia sp. TaxID=2212373 RepID=UPI004048829B